MVMGERGMADMGAMEMPIPDNTLPMMTGKGPFGSVEMGGMFSIVKIREGLGRNDYKDPGWYRHPRGSVAYEWTGAAPVAQRAAPVDARMREGTAQPVTPAREYRARKPSGHGGH
jgi:hypothetical protein